MKIFLCKVLKKIIFEIIVPSGIRSKSYFLFFNCIEVTYYQFICLRKFIGIYKM